MSQPPPPLCLLLSPTLRTAAWREALNRAAEAAGFSGDGQGSLARQVNDEPVQLMVRSTEEGPPPAGHSCIALIVDTHLAPAALALHAGLAPPAHGWEASRQLAALHDIPGRTVQVAPGTPVHIPEIDLRLVPPDASAAAPPHANEDPDLAAAFALYGPAAAARVAPSLLTYDRVYNGAAGWIDLTGRPRLLVYGPSLWLPAGRWALELHLEVYAGAEGRYFQADWGTQTACENLDFRPERPGRYRLNMTYDWATAAPAEFRLKVFEGCFEGTIQIRSLDISRVHDDSGGERERDVKDQ